MFCPRSAEWPIQHADPLQASSPRGGVAPLRHELALARYLEQQAAHPRPAAFQLDLRSGASRLFAWIARRGRAAVEALGVVSSDRPRHWAG
jgi:hypothetical protein